MSSSKDRAVCLSTPPTPTGSTLKLRLLQYKIGRNFTTKQCRRFVQFFKIKCEECSHDCIRETIQILFVLYTKIVFLIYIKEIKKRPFTVYTNL